MPRPLSIDDLDAIAVPEQPALSPDGSRIVYVLRRVDLEADCNTRCLWSVDVAGGSARRLTDGPADAMPAWSPDGTRLAFLRASDEQDQIWLIDGQEPRSLTSLPLGAGSPVWSPDGSRIAFTARVDRAAEPGEDDRTRAARFVAPIVADRLDYYVDGEGWTRSVRRHLHVVDIASGACTQLTDGDWNAGVPSWSPDGTRLAFTAAMTPDADLSRRSAAYVVDAAGDGHADPVLVGSPNGWSGPGGWSSSGDALLLAGTLGAPNAHYGLLRVPLDGGATVNLAAPLDRNVMFGSPGYPGATPRAFGDDVLFCIRDRGRTHLYSVPATGGDARPVLTGKGRNVSGLSIAAGRAAVVVSDESTFGEVVTIDLVSGEETTHTNHSASIADFTMFARVEREFAISDGSVVHGWLMRDPEATGPQPLLLDAHGGPHNAWNEAADEVHLYHQELVSRGWSVLVLNPRASDGYGEVFFTGAVGNWGIADAKDFLEPLDQLVAEGIADPGRLALTGYSYGGYMTCYLTSRDSRFAAAVGGGVIADLTSTAGTTDNRRGLTESQFGGQPWEDRAHYAAMSPLTTVEKVRTPTLILHGEADTRCPVGQAEQWHTALRDRGIPTQLVLYPGASHVFVVNGRPSHRIDYNRRVVDWVERFAG